MDPMASGPNELQLDNALWRFVLSFYAREGVSQACLTLQDRLGVDVDILLLAIFAEVGPGIVLDAGALAAADNLVRDWRSDILGPLRRARVRLKSGPAPAPSAITEQLRNRIKAAELEAEQIELAMLADWLDRQSLPPASARAAENVPQEVARYFAARADDEPFTGEINEALCVLLRSLRGFISPLPESGCWSQS